MTRPRDPGAARSGPPPPPLPVLCPLGSRVIVPEILSGRHIYGAQLAIEFPIKIGSTSMG